MPTVPGIRQALDGVVQHIVTAFADMIGTRMKTLTATTQPQPLPADQRLDP